MVPSLTAGSINRILDGEDVSGTVIIQILGCKKIPGTGNDRYRLLISDGVTGCPFVMLGTQLNSLVTNKELEKFTIVRVDRCVCNEIQPDRKVILLLNLTVLVPGTEVNEKIGNPTIASVASPGGTAEINHLNDNNNESLPEVLPASFISTSIMERSLTAGSINQMLNGEDVSSAVVQILGCKKIPGVINDRYRLLISDGVIGCPFVMLGTQLNSLVTNKELEKFTIVRVDKCICNQITPDRRIIILLNLTVLAPGAEVNEKIGHPTPESNYVNSNNNEPLPARFISNVVRNYQMTLPSLTAGSINRIFDGEDVSGAVIQILGCKKVPGTGNNRYRLLISDGVTGCPFAVLGTQLNSLASNKELEKFTIVRVDKCECVQIQPDRKVIILLNLTVLVPGAEVNEKIGNPSCISDIIWWNSEE